MSGLPTRVMRSGSWVIPLGI